MPALTMKNKLSSECVRRHGLHVCRNSTKISKDSCSQVKTLEQAAVLDTCIQNHQDGSSNIDISGQNIVITEAKDFQNILDEASTHILKVSSLSAPLSIGQLGLLSATCPCNMETIFSHNLEDNDAQLKLMNHSDAVKDENSELPHLVADESDDGSCSSSDSQTCSVLNFYSSESFPALPFDTDMGFTYVINAACSSHELTNSDIMIDMAERYMILPFLEKTAETSNIHVEESEETMMNSDDACLYLAIHQMKSSDQETEITCCGDLDKIECFDPQLAFSSLADLPEALSPVCPILLPKELQKTKPITLVLDLDETLVHSTLEHCDDADFTFPVFLNMKQHTVYVRCRPHLQLFLERVAQIFEIVIFTASQSIYAEQLLDILDPEKKLISQRIYRESCIFSDGSYTKDLTVLGVDLAKVAIINNSPQVFQLQVNNGIPIKSWFHDPQDHALLQLLPFLESLADADDVRPIIAKKFRNKE
ncbi:CTD small phosphatase-like protein 2 isoform X1 [Phoenix dactylifera]|uniref:CTD small phosphatase-like protein 2 isoform X1 n=1 Tax=Phoenix dactylifera TaxID=42345 RepID=A0A8B9AMB1_PHODC|nr:CTD small phosphatase-like protein 2 isoform X1 [Phoenix dactylifera]XP_038987510.1 CTD small phosphatase-like protein 2 isoform X1 [Phoenix dactylifera]XP_038987511.1 CTD small phosphatase-like protein 2 isoform X1 [Phoenix dactylifera]XP_038987512.1 CTD small phosphatase-like protein 2 isoform X1 [Phoenix dactylifera]